LGTNFLKCSTLENVHNFFPKRFATSSHAKVCLELLDLPFSPLFKIQNGKLNIGKKILSVFGGCFMSMNICPRKEERY
jgi:hypothetical protein